MSMVAVAIGSAVASTAGSVYSANKQSSAISGGSKRALRYQAAEAKAERDNQNRILTERRADFQPWRDSGRVALTQITDGISRGDFDMPEFDVGDVDLEGDPGYQFRMDQGQKALENSAAVRGGALSGAAVKAATRYGQDVGSQEYGNAYARHADSVDREGARRRQRFNLLNTLSNQGVTAAAQQSGASGDNALVSSRISDRLSTAGADSINRGARATADGYAGVTTAVNQGLQNWLTYRASQSSKKAPKGGAYDNGAVTNSSNALRWNNTILN